MSRPHPNNVAPARRGGFTLLELMISIALVLVLILGVNTVFSLTSQTVSAGNALGGAFRANQAMHGVIYQDFRSMIVGQEAPCFVIVNQRRNAWRSPADREADKDGNNRTFDFNGDGTEDPATETIANGTYNFRNHRIDKLCFFARGKFYRQTGTGTRFWDADPSNPGRPLSSDEAWIKYGFLALPDNATNPTYRPPGDQNNPQANPNNFYSTQWILGRHVTLLVNETTPAFTGGVYEDNSTATLPLQPLDPDAVARGETNEQFQFNRYDVALTRIAAYRQKVAEIPPTTDFRRVYWLRHGDFYWRGNNFVSRPIDPASVSRLLPIFVPGASQFIVEFSGDFVAQDADGLAVSAGADGIADYMVYGNGANAVRRTRWYGYDRDLDGNGVINARFDVVPVANVFASGGPQPQPYERRVNDSNDPNRYIVGWGADAATRDTTLVPRPTMLRITIVVDDNRLADGQTFEFVGSVQ